MTRFIDVNRLCEWLKNLKSGFTKEELVFRDELIEYLQGNNGITNVLPTADVAKVKHAYWQVCEDEYEICASEFVCSNCKESFVTSELTDEQFLQMLKYCPNCGAKMNGK